MQMQILKMTKYRVLGMVSNNKSVITIFGLKKCVTKFYTFDEKISTAFDVVSYFDFQFNY